MTCASSESSAPLADADDRTGVGELLPAEIGRRGEERAQLTLRGGLEQVRGGDVHPPGRGQAVALLEGAQAVRAGGLRGGGARRGSGVRLGGGSGGQQEPGGDRGEQHEGESVHSHTAPSRGGRAKSRTPHMMAIDAVSDAGTLPGDGGPSARVSPVGTRVCPRLSRGGGTHGPTGGYIRACRRAHTGPPAGTHAPAGGHTRAYRRVRTSLPGEGTHAYRKAHPRLPGRHTRACRKAYAGLLKGARAYRTGVTTRRSP